MRIRGRLIRGVLLGFAAASLAACTLEPEYHRPASPVSPVGAAAGTEPASAADIGWRELFTDPQLQGLVALALQNNRDLRVAALNVQAAQAQYRIQRADLLPNLAVSAEDQIERAPANVLYPGVGGVFRTYTAGIGFTNYELDFFGRIRSLDHAALQQYFGYRETQRSAQLSLVAEVAGAYLTVLADETLLQLTRDTLKSQSDSYELTRKTFDSGAATALTLRQAETTVDAARANLAAYTRQLAQDRDALGLLLGAPLPADLDTSAGLTDAPLIAELPAGVPSNVLIQRPDVLAAEHQLIAANADIGAARAAFFPRILLTGSYGSASIQLSGLFKGGSEEWTFTPQLSVPIFSAGANAANLQAMKIAREIAVAQYEKAIQTAFREVNDGLAAHGTLDDQLAAQQALAAASDAAYQLAQLRFRNGVDSFLTVLDAQRSLYSAQQGLEAVRLARWQNVVTLYKALGGGWREHTVPAAKPPAG